MVQRDILLAIHNGDRAVSLPASMNRARNSSEVRTSLKQQQILPPLQPIACSSTSSADQLCSLLFLFRHC